MISKLRSSCSKSRRRIVPRGRNLYYGAPVSTWSLDWDTYYITKIARIYNADRGKNIGRNCSLSVAADSLGTKEGKRNTIVTIFHGERNEPKFSEALNRIVGERETFAKIHTSSKIMEDRLFSWGLAEQKLVCILHGVGLKAFSPPNSAQKEILQPLIVICCTRSVVGTRGE